MSTDVKNDAGGAAPPAADDLVKNLKAEFNRKLENTESLLKNSTQQLLARIDAMAAAARPPVKAPVENDDDLETEFYKSPGSALKKVADRTRKEVMDEINKRDNDNAQRNTTVAKLYKDFPELNDEDHLLTKRAIEIYNENTKTEGASPAAYRAAVTEAALEQGIKPKKLRPNDADDAFVLGSNGERRPAKRKDGELSEDQKTLAGLLGIDPEKVKKRINKRGKFERWE